METTSTSLSFIVEDTCNDNSQFGGRVGMLPPSRRTSTLEQTLSMSGFCLMIDYELAVTKGLDWKSSGLLVLQKIY